MADFPSRNPDGLTFGGLLQQTYVTLIVSSVCLCAVEGLRRVPRRRGNPRKVEREMARERERVVEGETVTERAIRLLGSREALVTGYLYLGRCYSAIPSPPHPRIPLMWIKQVLSFSDAELLPLVGGDATVYLRFLRGCWYFVLLHTLTTMVILFPIHYIYSKDDLDHDNMAIASLSSLVDTKKGKSLLWVHMVLAFWITGTWVATLLWILRGVLRYRETVALTAPVRPAEAFTDPYIPDPSVRCRTIMVTNIPNSLRTDRALSTYFAFHLSRSESSSSRPTTPGAQTRSSSPRTSSSSAIDLHTPERPSVDELAEDMVERVVIVRKMSNLVGLIERRDEVLRRLELAHIKLAKRALEAVKERLEDDEERRRLGLDLEGGDGEEEARMARLVKVLAPFAREFERPPSKISAALKSFVQKTTQCAPSLFTAVAPHSRESSAASTGDADAPSCSGNAQQEEKHETVWEALHSMPRTDLDAFQPLTRIQPLHKSLFAKGESTTVPTIDYLGAKVNLLSALIAEHRARPLSDFPPASTAFVTFRTYTDAERAWRTLPNHPMRPLTCIARPAPQFTDLDWERLVRAGFTGQTVRDWVVAMGIWGFQIFWIFPISALAGLVSIQQLSRLIPNLRDHFDRNPQQAKLLSGLLPTLIVAGITLLVPVLLFLIGRKAQTLVTYSKLHDQILIRYWKFLVLNIVVFFCIGVTAFRSFLTSFRNQIASPLDVVAGSFPQAAPFFASWLILQASLHSMLQLGLLGLPLITYFFGVRTAKIPRKRAAGTQSRTIDYHYWLPNHLLVLTVVLVFTLLNPLVIPFALIYFSVANVVFRNQFLHVYARRYYERNGRILAVRLLRYSLDGMVLGQVTFLAFNVVLRNKTYAGLSGALVAVTVLIKLFITRHFKARYFALEALDARRRADEEVDEKPAQPAEAIDSEKAKENANASEKSQQQRPLRSRLSGFFTWHPASIDVYSTVRAKGSTFVDRMRRKPNPFVLHGGAGGDGRSDSGVFQRYNSIDSRGGTVEDGGEDLSTPGPYWDKKSWPASRPVSLDESKKSRTVAAPLKAGLKMAARVPQVPGKVIKKALAPSAPKAEKPPLNLATVTDLLGVHEPETLVTPHPPFPRWDDTPDHSVKYDCPYYVNDLDSFLWLPRDPTGPIDLDDTIELHRSLVCKGDGQLGDWPPTFNTVAEAVADAEHTADQELVNAQLHGQPPPLRGSALSMTDGEPLTPIASDTGNIMPFPLTHSPILTSSPPSLSAPLRSDSRDSSFLLPPPMSPTTTPKRRTLSESMELESLRSDLGSGGTGSRPGSRPSTSRRPTTPRRKTTIKIDGEDLDNPPLGRQRSRLLRVRSTSRAHDSPAPSAFHPPDAAHHERSATLGSRRRGSSGASSQHPHASPAEQHPLGRTGRGRGRSNTATSIVSTEALLGQVIAEECAATTLRVEREREEARAQARHARQQSSFISRIFWRKDDEDK